MKRSRHKLASQLAAALSLVVAGLAIPASARASTVFNFQQPVITNTPSITPAAVDGISLTITGLNGSGNAANVNQSTEGAPGIGIQGGGSARIGNDEIAIFTFDTPVNFASIEFNTAINSSNPLFDIFLDGTQVTNATVNGNPLSSPFGVPPNAVTSWSPSVLSPVPPADGITEIRVQALATGTGFRITSLTVAAVPEPSRTLLITLAAAAVILQRRRLSPVA